MTANVNRICSTIVDVLKTLSITVSSNDGMKIEYEQDDTITFGDKLVFRQRNAIKYDRTLKIILPIDYEYVGWMPVSWNKQCQLKTKTETNRTYSAGIVTDTESYSATIKGPKDVVIPSKLANNKYFTYNVCLLSGLPRTDRTLYMSTYIFEIEFKHDRLKCEIQVCFNDMKSARNGHGIIDPNGKHKFSFKSGNNDELFQTLCGHFGQMPF